MGFYCMRNDSMGLCMASVVYFCTILGQLVFFMIILVPDMKETYTIVESSMDDNF